MRKKRALITGAAGFIGRNLTKYLNTKGWDVLPVDNLSVEPVGKIPDNLWLIDLLDLSVNDLSNLDLVVHFAAHKSVPNSFLSREEIARNVLQDRHILEIATSAAVPKVFVASSCEVYGRSEYLKPSAENDAYNPMSPYAVSKVSLELLANVYQHLSTDTSIVALRFFNIYGSDEGDDAVVPRFIRDILETGRLTIEGDGHQRRDFSYIDNVVRIIYELSNKNDLPKIINIGSGQSCSINELASIVLEYTGHGAINYQPGRRNEIHEFCADIGALKKILDTDVSSADLKAGIYKCIRLIQQRNSEDYVSRKLPAVEIVSL